MAPRGCSKNMSRNLTKAVILTNSVTLTIYGDAIDSLGIPNHTFDETMWNTTSSNQQQYNYSNLKKKQEM